jgi:hypothetical protein
MKKGTKEKAWKAFSKYIRARDKRCVTCITGGAENAGHFHHNVLDFDEENVNAQCVRCNKWLHGNLNVYSAYLLRKLGSRGFLALDKRHYLALRGEKKTSEEYLEIETLYTDKFRQLELNDLL